MKRNILFFVCLLFLFLPTQGQSIKLSKSAEVSILTCGTSDLIHAIYGHTAIRVNDPVQNWDVVFNYGVFSFSAPYFAYRFAKGQTDYLLAAEYYSDFYDDYIHNGRSIDEQVLNFTQPEKQQLLDFLINNAKPENREYRYNFFFDNCATRVRDVIENQVDGSVVFPDEDGEERTFRQHVADYQKVLPWTNFGIELALGSPADEVASAYQEMFLPEYLMKHFATAEIRTENGTRPLVKKTNEIFFVEKTDKGISLLSPFVILTLLLLVVVYVTYHQYRRKIINYSLDYFLLFFTGIVGVIALWFVLYSEHPAMHPNYNMWWAVPTNMPFMFLWMVKKWRAHLKWYWVALSAWLIIFLLFNWLAPQSFHIGFYAIILMTLLRSLYHCLCFSRIKQVP